MLFDQALTNGEKLSVTFIDYSTAFDSISHKFLDDSRKRAGASRKTRAIFRAIYAAAEGIARVRGLDNKQVYSASFKVRRGVIQGDIISPIFFILTMEQIFRVHDASPAGVSVGNYLHGGVLGYADDAAIVAGPTEELTECLNKISTGSKQDADMSINASKTKNMHVEKQAKIAPPSVKAIKETEATYKHECEFCGRRCKTARGLKIHKAACACQHGLTDHAFTIDRINAVFGTVQRRWYRVEWEGYPGEDTWEPARSLVRQGCEDSIKRFWCQSTLNPCTEFIPDPDDIWRCYTCGKGFNTSRSLKCHITRTHPKRT